MSRVDKYDPKVGGYRATLAADFPGEGEVLEALYGVGHDAEGKLVIGAGVTGITGVWVWTKNMVAGKRCDAMTSGEVVEFGPTAGEPGVDFGSPGSVYYSDSAGNIVGGLDEIQVVTVTDDQTVFNLSFDGEGPTADLDGATATAAQVKSALEALANINSGDVAVSGDAGGPFSITFGGQYADGNVAELTGTNATVSTTTPGGGNTGLVRVGHTVEGQRLIVRVEN